MVSQVDVVSQVKVVVVVSRKYRIPEGRKCFVRAAGNVLVEERMSSGAHHLWLLWLSESSKIYTRCWGSQLQAT